MLSLPDREGNRSRIKRSLMRIDQVIGKDNEGRIAVRRSQLVNSSVDSTSRSYRCLDKNRKE